MCYNLADCILKPIFKANGLKWKGWYAYRRGLSTNLHELGVPDIVIQAILMHEDIRSTQRSYIKLCRESSLPPETAGVSGRLCSSCTAKTAKRFGKLKKANTKPT
jgi:hypothetical protein